MGTGGNDSFVAADHNKVTTSGSEIFGLGDDVKGGAGTDTLTVLGNGALGSIQLAKFDSVEKATLTSDSLPITATDLSSLVAGGLTDLTVEAGGGVSANNLKKAVVAHVKGAALAGDAGVVFNYTDAAPAVITDAATLVLEGATGNLPTVARAVTNGDINTLTINASGVSNVLLGDNGGNDLRTLTVNATGKTTLGYVSNNVKTIDASASTASVIIDATATNAGVVQLNAKLGSGDDKLTVGNTTFERAAATTNASTFDGGNGSADEFVLQNDFDNTVAGNQRDAINKLVGFEQFTVDGDALIDASRVTSVSKFGLQDTVGNMATGATFTNLSNANSIAVQSDYGWVDLTMTTGQTVANLEVKSTAGGTDVGNNSIVNGVQTLNITSTQTAASHATQNTIGNLLVNNATNFLVNVSGAQDIRLGNGTAGNNVQFVDQRSTIDASTLTGKLNVNGSLDNDIIKGGSAADTIRGNLGADTLTGNGGNDTFVFAFGGAATPATPAVAEIHDVTAVAPLVAGVGAVNAVNVNGTVFQFTAGATVTATAAAIQAAIGNPNITVTAINATTLRVTDASGNEITALDLRNDASAAVPAATTTAAVTSATTGNAVVPAVASETTLSFGSTANVAATASVAIDIGGNTYTAVVPAGSTITAIAAALQNAVQTDLTNPIATATVTVVDATTLHVRDTAGNDIDESTFALLDAGTPLVPPALIPGVSMVEVSAAVALTSNSVSTINFGALADIAATGELVIDLGPAGVITVDVTAGSNINTIAAAIQTAMLAPTGPNLVGATAVVATPTSITVDTGTDDNTVAEINEAAFVANTDATLAVPAAPITVGVLATEVAAGATEIAAVADTYTFDYGTGADIGNITIVVGGQTLNVDVSATTTDAQVVTALNAAATTAGLGSIFSDTAVGTTTDGGLTITVPFGTVVAATASVTDLPTAVNNGTAGSGGAAVEFQDGTPAGVGVGVVASESNITTLDTITDFVKGADKIDLLDFASGALAAPTKAWFAGDVTATAGANNLAAAIALAVSDVNGASQTGSVALAANEAVLFQYAGNTYVLVNDGTAAYSPTDDVLVKITGSLGLTEGALTVSEFFA